jgi:hypothetical protein
MNELPIMFHDPNRTVTVLGDDNKTVVWEGTRDEFGELLDRIRSGRLVDREAIDYDEIADWFWAITPNEAKHVLRRLGDSALMVGKTATCILAWIGNVVESSSEMVEGATAKPRPTTVKRWCPMKDEPLTVFAFAFWTALIFGSLLSWLGSWL